eukprot:11730-Heterococcus_DN1.PRE.3
MHRVLSTSSCRTLAQLRIYHSASKRTPDIEAVWQRTAASAAPVQRQPPPYKLYLAAVPIVAASTILAAQQISEPQSQAAALPEEATLLASHKRNDTAKRRHQPSVAAATCAVQAYTALSQHDRAASVLDALRQQGHWPQGVQQMAWADVYYKAGRFDAARYLLQQAVLRSPRDDAAKIARLCDINMRLHDWAAVSAAIAQAPVLSSSDVKWLRSSFGERSIKKNTDADGFANSIMMLAVNREHAHALAVLKRAHGSGAVVPDALISVMLIACCVDAKFDSLRELLSTMAAAGINLDVRSAESVAQVCAAHDSTILEELLPVLQSIEPLTTQCCALKIAAALKLNDVDTALELFDTMKQQGIERDEHIYPAKAAECYIHRYDDCMHVLDQAKAAGLMAELTYDESNVMLHRLESAAESNFKLVQSIVRAWARQGGGIIDLTAQGCVPQQLRATFCERPSEVAVAALRLLLQEVAEHNTGDTVAVTRAVLMVSNYMFFSGPFSDTLKIVFRTGSACSDELARVLRAELQSGTISVSSSADDGTTTYSIHVPGLRVYCADSTRKAWLERIPQLKQQ